MFLVVFAYCSSNQPRQQQQPPKAEEIQTQKKPTLQQTQRVRERDIK